MIETAEHIVVKHMEDQSAFFATNQTKDIHFRVQQLRKLKKAIVKYQAKIEAALWEDLHKSPEEAYLTEISIVTGEIDNHIKHLKKWANPKRVSTPLHVLPSSSKIRYETLGVALIVAPWNYPFQLVMNPLVGAISSGCCCVLKPSPDAPSTAKVMEDMIAENFASEYICMVQGGRETNTILFKQGFDYFLYRKSYGRKSGYESSCRKLNTRNFGVGRKKSVYC